jgi:hypothetical protein
MAEAQSFKVYELLIQKDKIADFSTTEEMIEAANDSDVKISAYADLPDGKNGVWQLDQTHLVRYAEKLDTSGEPIAFTDRKVGLLVRIEEQADGKIDVYYHHTKLEAWIPFSQHKNILQPIFTTTEITPGPINVNGFMAIGGLTNQDGVLHIIIQKIESK